MVGRKRKRENCPTGTYNYTTSSSRATLSRLHLPSYNDNASSSSSSSSSEDELESSFEPKIENISNSHPTDDEYIIIRKDDLSHFISKELCLKSQVSHGMRKLLVEFFGAYAVKNK